MGSIGVALIGAMAPNLALIGALAPFFAFIGYHLPNKKLWLVVG
jgi:hypothetical protein